jgi:anti-anti-sigma factor
VSSGENYYRSEQSDGCWIITLLPELNDKQWADIEKVGTEIVDKLSAAQSPRFIVDLTPLSYMGSAMVALIVRLYKAVNGRSGQMVVVNQHELVFEVLKLAGLTKLWTIVENRDKAYAALGVKRRSVSAKEPGTGGGGGNGLLVAGLIGTVGAIVGLALMFSPQQPVSHKIALLIDVGFAALGMIVGTLLLVNQTGARRNVGIALLAICLIALVGGIVAGPDQSSPSKENKASKSAAASNTTETVAVSPPKTTPAPAADPPKAPAELKTVAAAKPVTGAKSTLPTGPMGSKLTPTDTDTDKKTDKKKDKDKGK